MVMSLSSHSLTKGLKNAIYHFRGRKVRNKAAVKYAATKLQEKGVLLVNIQSIHRSKLHIS